jgi:hypothetical protein
MDTVMAEAWTTNRFLAWEDRQEGKHEFDGQQVIPMTGGIVAHQRTVFNLCLTFMRLLEERPFTATHRMRRRIGTIDRYPDVVLCATPLDQTTRTLTDAITLL